MTLYAELVNPDNKILWSHEAAVKSDDKTMAAVLPEELRNNPDEQEKLLRAAAHRASEKLMENYQQKESKEKPRMDANEREEKRPTADERRFTQIGIGRLNSRKRAQKKERPKKSYAKQASSVVRGRLTLGGRVAPSPSFQRYVDRGQQRR